MRRFVIVTILLVAVTAAPLVVDAGGGRAGEVVVEQERDASGRLVEERGFVAGRPDVSFVRHYFHAQDAAKGGGKPGGGIPGNDCSASQYRLTGWRWTAPLALTTTAYPDLVQRAALAWDNETGGALLAGVAVGGAGVAGTYDGVNQIDWVSLGASSTIAVTTTWYYRGSGVAVESDGQYNTYYAWATDGRSDAMDVLNIVTHEVGHSFGLDHPRSTPSTACLTMYAYASEGETQKRTLGSGDIYGIRAAYG